MSNNWSRSDSSDRLNGLPKETIATNSRSSMLDPEIELQREQGGGIAARQMFATSTSAYPSSNPNQRGATAGIDPRASGGAAPPYAFAGSGRGTAGGLPPPSVGGDDRPNMPMHYIQRAREFGMLQMELQEREVIEAEIDARNRHMAEQAAMGGQLVGGMDRARMRMEIMAELQHRDQEAARLGVRRESLVEPPGPIMPSQHHAGAMAADPMEMARRMSWQAPFTHMMQQNGSPIHSAGSGAVPLPAAALTIPSDRGSSTVETAVPSAAAKMDSSPSTANGGAVGAGSDDASSLKTSNEISNRRDGSPGAAESAKPLPAPSEVKSSTTATKKRKKVPAKSGSATGSKAKKAKKTTSSKKAETPTSSLIKRKPGVPTMDDPVPAITDAQYENVEALMSVFCKVPFLAEFSRPVALLHPELVTLYNKIIHHPMDLGHICRLIRRREYKSTRDIQLDVWRVFSNCIKFHMSPSNRDNAIPSFISIAMHLREFFNILWQEYLLPSDAPPRMPGGKVSHVHSRFQKRADNRKERIKQVSSTILTDRVLAKVVQHLQFFLSSGGKVDELDRDTPLGNVESATGKMALFIEAIRRTINTLQDKISSDNDVEYTAGELVRDIKRTYTEDVSLEVLKKMKITTRLDRILGKILAPLHEVSCRGVNQSSIWGCMAAAIWARESKKKPYWPAIVLGILAPDDQLEEWHQSVTDRNEARLPEKLRADLKVAKRRAEQGLKKQGSDPMSYFLVEFMGTHEFIWVKESDIIENFDPEDDVNVGATNVGNITKKRRGTGFNTKQMSAAIEEGRWALEEFEIQLSNACGDISDDDFDEEQGVNDSGSGYTFDALCKSDDEADMIDEQDDKGNESDVEEQNELLASDGLLDFSAEGRKKAKARAAALKRQNAALAKKEKEKATKAKKAKSSTPSTVAVDAESAKLVRQLELEEKRERRETDARRKKRVREHEKQLKDLEKKAKKKSKPGVHDVPNKKDRANAIVNAFLVGTSNEDDTFKAIPFVTPGSNHIDPSNLFGMALAFRAAAGEIPVEDTGGEVYIHNDWEKIDSKSSLVSSERCLGLQQQIVLMEKEIIKQDMTTERRQALTQAANKHRMDSRKRMLEKEVEIRKSNCIKRKAKVVKKADKKGSASAEKSKKDNETRRDHELVQKQETEVNKREKDEKSAQQTTSLSLKSEPTQLDTSASTQESAKPQQRPVEKAAEVPLRRDAKKLEPTPGDAEKSVPRKLSEKSKVPALPKASDELNKTERPKAIKPTNTSLPSSVLQQPRKVKVNSARGEDATAKRKPISTKPDSSDFQRVVASKIAAPSNGTFSRIGRPTSDPAPTIYCPDVMAKVVPASQTKVTAHYRHSNDDHARNTKDIESVSTNSPVRAAQQQPVAPALPRSSHATSQQDALSIFASIAEQQKPLGVDQQNKSS